MKSIVDYLGGLERQLSRLSLAVILACLGAKAAGKYLNHSPIVRRTQARILWLHQQIVLRKGSDEADRFAIAYLSERPRIQDYNTILLRTGTNRLSTERLSASLPAVMKTASKSSATYIALISALLERGEIDLVTEQINGAPDDPSKGWHPLLYALIPRPLVETNTDGRGEVTLKDLQPRPCRSRLIIMDEELSPTAIKSLAGAADKITLLQYGDLYGRIDLAAVQAALPDCVITVEHARSRVDRFHQRYFDLHRRTLEAAETLSRSFVHNTPWLGEFVPGLRDLDKDLTLELADKLFFKALRLEGVYRAALDPSFDSVIVSFGEGFELWRMFYSDTALWQDSRIECCCRSSNMNTLTKFASRVSDMRRRVTMGLKAPVLERITALEERSQAVAGQSPPAEVSRYLKTASKVPACTRPSHLRDRQTVAFVLQDGRAYGRTGVQMATHLHAHYNVDVILTQGSASGLPKALASAQNDPYLASKEKGRQPGYLKLAAQAPNSATSRAFSNQFNVTQGDTIKELLEANEQDHAVSSAIDFLLTAGLSQAILGVLANACAVAALLRQQRYAAIAISPIRTPRNTQFTNLAREAGIPTIALEPHCVNAAYCRYGTILSDYAAVYSTYYTEEYDRYFGIPLDRCYSFGSPRILRPINYDPLVSRIEARRRIGMLEGDPPIIAVPTQPMPADHILAVWRMIVRAARSLDMPVRVLLKPHPEEGHGHVDRYRQVIAEEEASHLCFVADVDIKDLLIASELVLTAYSVTALEAAVLERNVAIVGKAGIAYPTEYDKILGIPFCCTEQETKAAILEAITLGRDALSGAKDFMAANPGLFDNSTFDRLAGVLEDVVAKGPGGIRRHEDLPSSLFVTAPFREYLV